MSFLSPHDKLKNYLQSLVSLTTSSFPNCNYFSDSDFTRYFGRFLDIPGQLSKISIFHMNIRSLNANHDKLFQLMATLNFPFDIMALSEVWSFNISMYSSLFPDYNFFYNLPKNSSVGGVGIYIRKSFTVSPRIDLSLDSALPDNSVESLFVEISKFSFRSLIGCLYRHPSGNITKFTESLESLLHSPSFNKGLSNCFCMGDVNLDLLKFDTHSSISNYIDILNGYNFHPLSILPTRVTESSSSLLDHIYFRPATSICNWDYDSALNGCLLADISDHFANVLVIPLQLNKVTSIDRPLTHIFSEVNKTSFSNELNAIDWSSKLYNCTDVNVAYKTFLDILTQSYDRCFPLIRISRKRSYSS